MAVMRLPIDLTSAHVTSDVGKKILSPTIQVFTTQPNAMPILCIAPLKTGFVMEAVFWGHAEMPYTTVPNGMVILYSRLLLSLGIVLQ
jgi:hypothetical protein